MKDKQKVLIIEDCCTAKIFFNPKKYSVNKDSLRTLLNSIAHTHDCTGYSTERLGQGELWIYFNPVRNGDEERQATAKKVVKMIKSFAVTPTKKEKKKTE